MHSLAGIDLNLVVALHALVEEASVTRAARRIGLSQPAMSHALKRLRSHYDDPLLVRTGRTMSTTPRALQLLEQLRPVLTGLQGVLAPEVLTPPQMAGTIRLVADDAMGHTLLPDLLAVLSREAPGLNVHVLARGAPGRKRLVRLGKADLALGDFSGAGMDLHRAKLYTDRWVTVVGEGHRVLDTPWTPAALANCSHILVSPTGGDRGDVDRVLASKTLQRRVAVVVPHFSTALAIVRRTEHVLTTFGRLVEAVPDGVRVIESPLEMPSVEVAMVWHPRTEHDDVHRWFRTQVERVASSGSTPSRGDSSAMRTFEIGAP